MASSINRLVTVLARHRHPIPPASICRGYDLGTSLPDLALSRRQASTTTSAPILSSSTGSIITSGGIGVAKASHYRRRHRHRHHLLNTSGVPALSSCGTGSPAATTGSNNQAGQITVGGGTQNTCTVTFANAYPNYAWCTISEANSTAAGATILPYISASSKTAFTITSTAASMAGAVFNYTCGGS